MRRHDREMPREFAIEVVDKCEYAVLAMLDPDGAPYCVPLSIVRMGERIYFHSARDGFKLDCLKASPRVCISCVGDTCRAKDKFTTEFESAIVRGTAEVVTDDAERIAALRALCERHTPSNMAQFDAAIERSLARTLVVSVSIESITAKRKKYDKNGEEMKFARME